MDVDDLISIGRIWCGYIRYRQPAGALTAARELADRINIYLYDEAPNLKVRVSPFQFYELLVFHTGKPYAYSTFIREFEGDLQSTLWIIDFSFGRRSIDDFSGYLLSDNQKTLVQAFVAIVYIAEYGRGYTNSRDVMLDFLEDVANGDESWSNLESCYAPALTFKEDSLIFGEEDEGLLN